MEAAGIVGAPGPCLPTPPPGAPGHFASSDETRLRGSAVDAGLTPVTVPDGARDWTNPGLAIAVDLYHVDQGLSAQGLHDRGLWRMQRLVADRLARLPPAPRRLGPGDVGLQQVLALIRAAFADMAGRIDPASSAQHLALADLTAQAAMGEVRVIGDPVCAAVILTPRPDSLYPGKLAVAALARGKGPGRRLVETAVARARALGLPAVTLQVRVELTQNQAAFAAPGFAETGRTARPGHDQPTAIICQRSVLG